MEYQQHGESVRQTPKLIQILLVLILTFSLIFNLIDHFWGFAPGLSWFSSLSVFGLTHGFIWQLVTHVFLYPFSPAPLSFSYLLIFFLNLYLFWRIGCTLYAVEGKRAFWGLYLGTAIVTTLVAICSLFTLEPTNYYTGLSSILYAFLVAWVILLPDVQILLFLTIPVKAKWAITLVLGSSMILELVGHQYTSFLTHASACAFSYLFMVGHLRRHSPFRALFSFEQKWMSLMRRPSQRNRHATSGKIYDFQTGKPVLRDEDFLNDCLDKISAHGKGALTRLEKLKLWYITRKMKRKT